MIAGDLTWQDWATAGAILAVSLAVGAVVGRITERLVHADDEQTGRTAVHFIGRLVGFVVVAAGVVYALSVLGVRLGPLLGALGLGGLAVAFAAQSILANLFASILLQIRHPFRRGDQIATGDHEGTVESVNFRTVVLRTFDGERVYVPCSNVLENAIVNHTARGTRRTTLEVGIPYAADLDATKQLLLDATSAVDGVLDRPKPAVFAEAFGEHAVELVVQFWHAPQQQVVWQVRSDVLTAVKRALDEAGIAIPFPQLDVHLDGAT